MSDPLLCKFPEEFKFSGPAWWAALLRRSSALALRSSGLVLRRRDGWPFVRLKKRWRLDCLRLNGWETLIFLENYPAAVALFEEIGRTVLAVFAEYYAEAAALPPLLAEGDAAPASPADAAAA